MDSLIELIFEPLFNWLVLKIKQLKAQVIYVTYSKQNNWINGKKNNKTYKKIILSDENLLNLFLSKEYRNKSLRDEKIRSNYIKNIIDRNLRSSE